MMRSKGGIRFTPFRFSILMALAVMCTLTASTSYAQIEWQGASGGNWDVPGNWVGGVVPGSSAGQTAQNLTSATILFNTGSETISGFSSTNSAANFELFGGTLSATTPGTNTFSMTGQLILQGSSTLAGFVVTASGGAVVGNNQTTTLDGITFAGGTNFTAGPNSTTNVNGVITNTGNFQINGGGGPNTDLTLGSATTFAGAGTVTLSTAGGGGSAIIQGNGETLTNNSTIQGNGLIGNGSLTIDNNGTINANVPGTLTINNSNRIFNTGIMEASGGGILNLDGVLITNAGGNITASSSTDTVLVSGNSVIAGGTLNNTGGGTLGTTANNTAFLDGVAFGTLTLNGTYTGFSNSTTNIQGVLQNNGNLLISGGGGPNTDLTLIGATTFQGSGTVTLTTAGGGGNAILGGNGETLTNNSTIQGNGIIGNGSLAINNNATINANVSGAALLLNGSGVVTNTGTLEASGGGVLNIQGVTVNNAGGNITASSSADTVQLYGSTDIQGGTLNNVHGGSLGTAGNGVAFLDGSTGSGAVTINGTYTAGSNSDTYILGTIITNSAQNGNLQVNAGGGPNTLILGDSANETLMGGGKVTLVTATGGGNAIIEQNITSTLTNVNNTIQGEGIIGNNGLGFVNESAGIVNANSTGVGVTTGLFIQGVGGTVVNAGLFEASNDGVLNINGNVVNNAGGNITANGPGATVQLYGGVTIQGGNLNNITGGTFGTPGGNVAVLDGSTASGSITINGTYTCGSNSDTYILGTIVNNGTININGGGGPNTILLSDSTNLTLTGGGTINLNTQTGGGMAILEQNVASTLTNVNNTIQGEGIIGNNGLTLVNTSGGVIDANSNGSGVTTALNLQGLGGTTINQGLIEATNSGTLNINGGVVNNSGANITATGAGASVQLFGGTTIQGGTLNNNGGNFFGTPGGNVAVLDGLTEGALTINGTYTAGANSNTYILGQINNNNLIQIIGGGGPNTLLLSDSANLTLTGGGTLLLETLTGGGNAFLEQNVSSTLTNVNNTIEGEGVIGNNGLTLVNTSGGTINANSTGGAVTTTLTLDGLNLTNQGLVEATNNGTLTIQGLTVNNFGGNIDAVGAGANVLITNSSVIQGGTLNNNGGAFFGAPSGNVVTLDGSAQGPITINGTFTSSTNTNLYLIGNINNQGNLLIDGGGGPNTLVFGDSANVLLTGGGTVTLNTQPGGGEVIVEQNVASTIENFNNTIQGNGLIGNNGLSLLNDAAGTVLANVSGGTLLINGAGTVTNNGTFEADAGSTLHLASVTDFTNFSGNTLTGGTYIVNGTSSATGTLQINSLGSTGGEIVNNAATIILNGPNSNFVDEAGLDALSNLAANTTALSDLTITGGRVLTIATSGNSFSNAGTVWVGTGSTLNIGPTGTGTFTQSGGITTVNGTLDPLSYNLGGGILAGIGTVTGNVLASGGTIAPGAAASTGELTINGNLNDTGSTLNIRLGGTGAGAFDVLDVTGTVNLGAGSVLDVSLFDGFTPTNGETFTFLDFLTGGLTSLGSPDFFGSALGLTTAGGTFDIVENGNDNLTLQFVGSTPPPPPPPPPNGTPEPAPMVMLASGALVWALLRRRSRGKTSE